MTTMTMLWIICGMASIPLHIWCGSGKLRTHYLIILCVCCTFLGWVSLLMAIGAAITKLQEQHADEST